MASFRSPGYRGEPSTCRWCGTRLKYVRVSATDADRDDPTYRVEGSGWASKQARLPGAYQDGMFCTLGCGYQWALRNVKP
jgi:hypothetical protein